LSALFGCELFHVVVSVALTGGPPLLYFFFVIASIFAAVAKILIANKSTGIEPVLAVWIVDHDTFVSIL
jgi:hypothetical protein